MKLIDGLQRNGHSWKCYNAQQLDFCEFRNVADWKQIDKILDADYGNDLP